MPSAASALLPMSVAALARAFGPCTAIIARSVRGWMSTLNGRRSALQPGDVLVARAGVHDDAEVLSSPK